MFKLQNGNIVKIKHPNRTNIYVADVDNGFFYDLFHRHNGYDNGFPIANFTIDLKHKTRKNVRVIKFAKTNWHDVLEILSHKKEIKWDCERE